MAFCHNEGRAQPHEGRSSFMPRAPDLMALRVAGSDQASALSQELVLLPRSTERPCVADQMEHYP